MRSRTLLITAGLALLFALVTATASARPSPGSADDGNAGDAVCGAAMSAGPGTIACAGGSGPIQHVIYVQFDNTHLLRDRPGVPSDLEQMPHLLNFMRQNGTLLSNDHTVLISHTAN